MMGNLKLIGVGELVIIIRIFSMTANLPYGAPMNTDNDY